MANRDNKKLITVKTTGPLPELNYITGPIIHPCWVNKDVIIKMVHNGKKVYEVNPENPAEKVLLTLKNIRLNNFGSNAGEFDNSSSNKQTPANTVETKPTTPLNNTVTKPSTPVNNTTNIKSETPKTEVKPNTAVNNEKNNNTTVVKPDATSKPNTSDFTKK